MRQVHLHEERTFIMIQLVGSPAALKETLDPLTMGVHGVAVPRCPLQAVSTESLHKGVLDLSNVCLEQGPSSTVMISKKPLVQGTT